MSTLLIKVLQQKILTDIPLTQHMGLNVTHYDGKELQIKANLTQNTNHRQTAFGGSINSLAILAAWGWLYLHLYEQNITARSVIQNGSTEYLLPVDNDFTAVCKDIDADVLTKFMITLKKKSIARIKLNVDILCNTKIAAKFAGDFVSKIGLD